MMAREVDIYARSMRAARSHCARCTCICCPPRVQRSEDIGVNRAVRRRSAHFCLRLQPHYTTIPWLYLYDLLLYRFLFSGRRGLLVWYAALKWVNNQCNCRRVMFLIWIYLRFVWRSSTLPIYTRYETITNHQINTIDNNITLYTNVDHNNLNRFSVSKWTY